MKMSCSGRPPSFGIVRETFMVLPQAGHTRVGEPAWIRSGELTVGVEGL